MAVQKPIVKAGVQAIRQRGRPRAFDEAALFRQAQSIFWRQGYAATSFNEVSAATGISKPSLYGAFTDKTGLFLKTLDLYFNNTLPLMETAFAIQPLRMAIERVLMEDIVVFTKRADQRGCYFICVFAEAARSDPRLEAVARKVWRRINQQIEARLKSARPDELPPGWDFAATSDMVFSTHVTLAVRARSGASVLELQNHVRRIAAVFP